MSRRKWFIGLAWSLGGVLGVYLSYVLGTLVFLSFGGLAWATKSEADVFVSVQRGSSLWPGRFSLSGVLVRFKDYNIEMEVRVDHAEVQMSLVALARRRLDVAWVRAMGTEYRLVHRVQDPVASARRLRAFPEIPGIERARHYDAPRPPPTGKKLWSVQFDSIEAEVRLAWLLEYQFRGRLLATGSFGVDPETTVQVGPCRVVVQDTAIWTGDTRIAHGASGVVTAQVAPFASRGTPISGVVPKLDATLDVGARIETLEFIRLYVEDPPLIVDGRGQGRGDLVLRRGQIQAGSSVDLQLDPFTVVAAAEAATGAARLELLGAAAGHFDVDLWVELPSASTSSFSIASFDLETALEHEDLGQVELRSVGWKLRGFETESPALLSELFGPSPLIPASSAFDTRGLLSLPERGPSELRAEAECRSTSFYLSGLQVGVTGEAKLECSGSEEQAACSVTAHAPYLLVDQQPSASAATLWLRANTRSAATVNLEKGTFEGDFELSGSDPKGVVSELIGKDWLAQLGLKLVPTGMLSGTLSAAKTSESFRLTNVDVSSGRSRVRGRFESAPVGRGAFQLDLPTNRWGFTIEPDGLAVTPFVRTDWLSR